MRPLSHSARLGKIATARGRPRSTSGYLSLITSAAKSTSARLGPEKPPSTISPQELYGQLRQLNARWGCPFYEGLVAKRLTDAYRVEEGRRALSIFCQNDP